MACRAFPVSCGYARISEKRWETTILQFQNAPPFNAMPANPDPLAQIVAALNRNAERLRGFRVFLFGSRATGDARPRSDFDIGVIGPSPLPIKDFFAIEDDLEALPTLYSIDWVDFNRVSQKFRDHAMQGAKIIYE